MTDDLPLAFAPLDARAEALAGTSPLPGIADRISLRDYVIDADIGAFQQERGHPQRLRFNVVVDLRAPVAAADDVDRILSYDRIVESVADALADLRLDLLETLAERIAALILAAPQALRVFVRIEKLDRGPGALGVEIVRAHAADGRAADGRVPGAVQPRPCVAYLDNATATAPYLPGLLDVLGGALVLTLGFPDLPRPQTGHRATQRRIDLLAIEQNAWSLAARDPRCVVVSSRTEIDWAMRQGGLVVWAPSKLVLDAVDGPADCDPPALALWLAELLDAGELIVHGAVSVPAGSRVPVTRAAPRSLPNPRPRSH